MGKTKLQCDYLIIGSGAMGMAFADTLLSESDASIIIVDQYPKPGGHWNKAYPFVTLHQPSAFYGVSSEELSNGKKDKIGLNKGLNDLATGAEVQAYYENVMRHRFLPSGRVKYFPKHRYTGNGNFHSIMNDLQYEVKPNIKTVDCTYLKTSVPSTHKPNFTVAPDVNFIPINGLIDIQKKPSGYTIIGGGKTGIDACLWLLEHGTDPDDISWVISRDAWFLDRKNTQPTEEFFNDAIGAQAASFEALANADSIDNLFERLEKSGVLLRLDPAVKPQMFHAATISQLELEELRKIKNIVRLGRVKHIDQDEIILDRGNIKNDRNRISVDCSASALTNLEAKPIFENGLITPQTVRSHQPAFSASFVAYVEANYEGDQKKNQLCCVVPLPNHDTDWIPMTAAFMMNQYNWNQDQNIRKWLLDNRLDGFSKLVKNINKEDPEKRAILDIMKKNAMPAMMKLQQFMTELNT